jgi:endonuclease V-like protein UPF0215 family
MPHPAGFNLVKIGEIAKLLGKPVTTVRGYTNSGLIPVAQTSASGTRWYDPQAVIDSVNGRGPKSPEKLNLID